MVKNYEKLIKCFKASCRVRTSEGLGSCTIIYSKEDNTFALTNFHVIENCLEYKQIWDNILKKKTIKEYTKVVEVLYPDLDKDNVISYTTVLADVIYHDREQDLALLQLRDKKEYPAIKWYPLEKVKDVISFSMMMNIQ